MTATDVITGEIVEQDEPTLGELEQVIERGLESFVDVGSALLTIKAGKRYREAGYSTFEDYCQRRWEISRGYGYRLLIAAATVEGLQRELSPNGDSRLPATESQARPLSKLPEEERAEAWTEAVEEADADGRSVTAADVERAVDKRMPTKTTTTERSTETRTTSTETPDEAPGPGASDREPPGRRASGAPVERESAGEEDADVINDAFGSNVDPGLAYRKRFTDAVSKAHDVTRFDVDRSIATAGESADGHRQLVKALAEWCETYLRATRPNHLRSAK